LKCILPCSATRIQTVAPASIGCKQRLALLAEISAAQRRNELIEKRLVTAQATYLLIAMRQKILNLPQTYARRLVDLKDVSEVQKVLKGTAISILNEIKDLPSAVTDPSWLESLEEKDG
jgi:hypothetical protein